jgi:DNA-directed RNA polymerase alpha subunit
MKHGAGPVTAADITESADVEIVNPELLLLTLDSDAGSIEMDLTVETGVGYRPAEHAEDLPIGIIPVDAIFTPVRRVNFIVSDTRVGQMTNFDRLIEIETDGTTTPKAALSSAAEILVQEFSRFAEIGRRPLPGSEDAPALVSANLLDAPIEELDLPMRAYNSLKRNNITKIGQLLALGDDELLRMRNFGKKSLDEMKERLALRGFIVPESAAGSADESDLPAAASGRGRRRRARPGGLIDAASVGRPQARPRKRPPSAHAGQPGGVGAPLREGPDHRGEGQGGPRPGRPHDHAGEARGPLGATPPGLRDAGRAPHHRQADGRAGHQIR